MTGRSVPRPKRAGEEFARGHYTTRGDHSPKKPRFDLRNPSALVADEPDDADDDDGVLDADEIGKRGQRTKRNAVNIDGYGSDSSNEGFDARAEAKAKAKAKKGPQSKDEEMDDMFADLDEDKFGDGDEDEEDGPDGKKKKKQVKFVDADRIEGQVHGSRSGGHVSANLIKKARRGYDDNDRMIEDGGDGKRTGDLTYLREDHQDEEKEDQEDVSGSDSDSSGADDEERAELDDSLDAELGAGAKRKHAPRLDAFNLGAEKEGGRFDEQLNYVRKAADPDAVHDTWMEGVSKKEMKRARQAQEQRDKELRQRAREDDAIPAAESLAVLITELEVGESVLEALARHGGGHKSVKKRIPKWQQRKKKSRLGKASGAGDTDEEMDITERNGSTIAHIDEAEQRRREAVEKITSAADRLLSKGNVEIYQTDRELLIRMYSRETGEQWTDDRREKRQGELEESAQPSVTWEYRWSDGRDSGEVHGPYDGPSMVAWHDAGYFGEGVEFRRVGDSEAEWKAQVDF